VNSPPTLTIARLTVREAVRRRLLAALAATTVALTALSAWGFHRLSHTPTITSGEVRAAVPQALILFMFMFSFVVALTASAIASPTIAAEAESGVLMTVATRPITRRSIVVGKWLGLAFLLAAYTAAVCLLEMVVVYAVSDYVPPNPALVTAYLFGEGLLLLTLSLLLSTRLSGLAAGVIGIALFGAAWLAGVVDSLGAAFNIDSLRAVGQASRLIVPTDGLWHGAIYHLEPDSLLTGRFAQARATNPFFSQTGPSWTYLLWVAAWLVVVLTATVVSFDTREL
jgi:ABC-type transport system involved in multi-copper enzyme maturation permease subunit